VGTQWANGEPMCHIKHPDNRHAFTFANEQKKGIKENFGLQLRMCGTITLQSSYRCFILVHLTSNLVAKA